VLNILNVLQNVFIWNKVVKILDSELLTGIYASIGLESEGARKRGRRQQTRKGTVLEEAGNCDKTWREVKSLAGSSVTPWLLMKLNDTLLLLHY